jgi:hypothetical protein
MGNAALDPLGGEFAQTLLHLPKPRAKHFEDIDRDLRLPGDQLEECGLRPDGAAPTTDQPAPHAHGSGKLDITQILKPDKLIPPTGES